MASKFFCICWRISLTSFLKFIGSGFEMIRLVSSTKRTIWFYLLGKADRLCIIGRAKDQVLILGEHHGLFHPNLRQKKSSYYLKQLSGFYFVGKFLLIWEILMLSHKNLICSVRYHGLSIRRPFFRSTKMHKTLFFYLKLISHIINKIKQS